MPLAERRPPMRLAKIVSFLVFLVACHSSSPPVSSPPAEDDAQRDQRSGGAETQDGGTASADLHSQLASLDASLDEIGKRIATTADAAKSELKEQLAAIEKRRDVIKAQLKQLADQADARAAKVRREARTALKDLQRDMQKLADRLKP
jgi:predicted trehalose synthase